MGNQEIKNLIDQLPASHQSLLKKIMKLCGKITQNEERNKMGAKQLAIVLAPNILYNDTDVDPSTIIASLAACNQVVLKLIDYYEAKNGQNTTRRDKKISEHSEETSEETTSQTELSEESGEKRKATSPITGKLQTQTFNRKPKDFLAPPVKCIGAAKMKHKSSVTNSPTDKVISKTKRSNSLEDGLEIEIILEEEIEMIIEEPVEYLTLDELIRQRADSSACLTREELYNSGGSIRQSNTPAQQKASAWVRGILRKDHG